MIRPAVLAPLVIAGLLIAVFALNIGRDPGFVPSALIGSKAPDFVLPALETVDAPGFSTADLTGKVSVVNVFASWCVPCRAEHPLLMQLAADEEPHGHRDERQGEQARGGHRQRLRPGQRFEQTAFLRLQREYRYEADRDDQQAEEESRSDLLRAADYGAPEFP